MNHSIISVINTIKTAICAKKLKITIKHNAKNVIFLRYLTNNGIVSNITRKGKVVIVTLKYSASLTPVLSNISVTSRVSHKRAKQNMKNLPFNAIVNINENIGTKTRLLGRFR